MVITTVTLVITLLITAHEPPSQVQVLRVCSSGILREFTRAGGSLNTGMEVWVKGRSDSAAAQS